MARRPRHGPGIQNRSGVMVFLYYLPWKPMNVVASLLQNKDTVVAIENRSIPPHFQRIPLTGPEGRFQCFRRPPAHLFELNPVQRGLRMKKTQFWVITHPKRPILLWRAPAGPNGYESAARVSYHWSHESSKLS